MMKYIIIKSYLIILVFFASYSITYGKANTYSESMICKPSYNMLVQNSFISLKCDDTKLTVELKERLEKELNKQIQLKKSDHCNPKFYKGVLASKIKISCGISHMVVQRLLKELLGSFQSVQNKIDSFEIKNRNTSELKLKAKEALRKGKLELAISLLDQIILLESETVQKTVKKIKQNLDVFEKSFQAVAKANSANGDLMRMQFKYEAAAHYFVEAFDKIVYLNTFILKENNDAIYYAYMSADSYFSAVNNEKAEEYYIKAIDLSDKYYGKNHIKTTEYTKA